MSGWDELDPSTPSASAEAWEPTNYGFKVRNAVTPDTGKPTKLREDGALFYGLKQGNKGLPGWFDANGKRVGDVPAPPADTLAPHQMNDEQIATKLLGLSPEEFQRIQAAPEYRAGLVKLSDAFDKPGTLKTALIGSQGPLGSLVGGAKSALNSLHELSDRIGGVVGLDPGGSSLALRQALGRAIEMNQNLGQRGDVQKGGFDPMFLAGQGAVGAAVGGRGSAMPTKFAAGEIVPTATTFTQRAMANALPATVGAAATTPGTSSQRTRAALFAAVTAPGATAVGEAIPWFVGKGINAARAFKSPGTVPDPTNLNQELLGRVAGDPVDVFQADLVARKAAGKKAASQAYQTVQDLGGQEPVSFQNLAEAVKTTQAELRALPLRNPEVRTAVQDIQQGLGGTDMDRTFSGAHRLRSHLGELAAQARDANNGSLARTYESLRSALTKDMDAFAAKDPTGKLGEAYRSANELFKAEVVPFFENPEIRRQIKAPFPDEQVNRLVKAGPDRVGSVVKMLDKDGKAAFQAQISDSAMKEAMDVNGDFIPGRFIKAMKDRETAYNLTFRGEDKWQMDGFIKIMKASKLVGDILPTGKLSHVMDTSVLAKKLFMTDAGRNLLLSASELTPGSKVFESLLTERLPRILAIPQVMPAGSKPTPQAPSAPSSGWDALAGEPAQ